MITLIFLCALSSHVQIASAHEPGQRLIITGHIFGPDGKARSGVIVSAHHADARGIYLAPGKRGPNPKVEARLWGRLATAADGSYRIDTIMPSGYGGGAAHVHLVLRDASKEQFQILQFDNGPNAGILTRDAKGVYHCVRNFRLKGAAR